MQFSQVKEKLDDLDLQIKKYGAFVTAAGSKDSQQQDSSTDTQ